MSDDLLDENMNAVKHILNMQNNDKELVEPPEVDNQTYQLETLNTLVLQDFRRISQNKKFPVSSRL
jgi:hypothetical protein